jgi:hypothetical protein
LAKYEGKLSIRIILTSSARNFLAGQAAEQPAISELQHMPNVDAVYDDADEWGPQPWRRGSSILHIELRRCESVLSCPVLYFPYSLIQWNVLTDWTGLGSSYLLGADIMVVART